jgi:hypothetical protein
MKLSDLLLSIFIVAVFIGLYVANVLAIGKKNVQDNWALYRCSPMVMPIANMFGHDTMKNFAYCIQNMQSDFMGPMLTPSNYSNALAAANIGALNKSNSNSTGMIGSMRGMAGNNIMGMFNVFGNISLLMGVLVNKIKDMMNKLGGVFFATFSIMQGASFTTQSTWNAVPGRLINMLVNSEKDKK